MKFEFNFENTEEDQELQREIEERNDAMKELSSILGGSSSCPVFPTSYKFERPGCIPRKDESKWKRISNPSFNNERERSFSSLPSSLSNHEQGANGFYF